MANPRGNRRATGRIARTGGPVSSRGVFKAIWPPREKRPAALACACLLLTIFIVILLLTVPPAALVTLSGHACIVLTGIMLPIAAALLIYDAALTRSPGSTFLATAIIFGTLQEVPMVILAASDRTYAKHLYDFSPLGTVAAVIALALFGAVSGRLGVAARSPLVVGVFLGATISLANMALIVNGHGFVGPATAGGIIILTIIGIALVLCITALAYGRLLPRWATRHLIAALVLGSSARLLPSALGHEAPRWWSIGLIFAASVILTSIAIRLLWQTVLENIRTAQSYAVLANTARADLEHDRELGHEMVSIVAGIVAASGLLVAGTNSRSRLSPQQLQEMIAFETTRLHRISSSRMTEEFRLFDIDEVLCPLVVAQLAMGRRVEWKPTGHVALSRPDTLAEVLNILLTNAARHAAGAVVRIDAELLDHQIRIRVADAGPGVPPSVAKTLFEWGARGPTSLGHGIGLQAARRLMHMAGGSVDLLDARSANGLVGATFVVSLTADRAVATVPSLSELDVAT